MSRSSKVHDALPGRGTVRIFVIRADASPFVSFVGIGWDIGFASVSQFSKVSLLFNYSLCPDHSAAVPT